MEDNFFQTTKAIKTMNESLNSIFSSPFLEMQRAQAQQMAQLFESINPSIELYKSINEAIRFSLPDFKEIFKSFERVKELAIMVKNDPDYAEFPFLMADFLSFEDITNLSSLWLDGKKQKVKDIIYDFTKDIQIQKDIKDELTKYGYFKTLEPVLVDAFEAHSNGKYSLSIPALYLLIDGAIIETFNDELCKQERYYVCEKCKKPLNQCPHCKEIIGPPKLTSGRIAKKLKETPKFTSKYMDCFGAFGFVNHSYPSKRSPILHGESKKYYLDRDLSTTLMLTLNSMINLMKAKNAQEETKTVN